MNWPRLIIPVPASNTNRRSRSSSTVTHSVLPPNRAVSWPARAMPPRVPQNLTVRRSSPAASAEPPGFSWPTGLGAPGKTRSSSWAFEGASMEASFSTGQPHAEQREKLLQVDRLRDVVRRAGFDALLAIVLHRLGRDRDDGKILELVEPADDAHGVVAVELGHHDVHQDHVRVGVLLQHLDAV